MKGTFSRLEIPELNGTRGRTGDNNLLGVVKLHSLHTRRMASQTLHQDD